MTSLTRSDESPRQPPADGSWNSARFSAGYLASYQPFSFTDGPGVRCAVYVSGCPFACAGCYNRAAQSFRYGQPYTEQMEQRIMADLAQPYVQGLSLLGGEPFLNTGLCLRLARQVRAELPDKDIWCWSGYTLEQLRGSVNAGNTDQGELLELIDVLVDGPFIESRKDLSLAFRGSSNQRVLHLKTDEAVPT